MPSATVPAAPSAHRLTVPPADAGRRLDQVLAQLLGQHSRSRLQGWIEAEIVARPSNTPGMTKSALLPTAPITPGDFNMNFGNQDPINDSQANITFTLAPDSSGFYRVSKLTLIAGPTTGIHIKHPKFYFITNTASFADPADSLGIVDLSVPANGSMTIGGGTVLLTNAPTNDPNTRIGIAFETLEKSQVQAVTVACKDFKDFNPALVKDLQGCAATCHGGRNGAATSACGTSSSTNGAPPHVTSSRHLRRERPAVPREAVELTALWPTSDQAAGFCQR